MNSVVDSAQQDTQYLKTTFGFTVQFYRAECEVRYSNGCETTFKLDIITDGIIKPLIHRSKVYDYIEAYFKQKHITCLEITNLYGINSLATKLGALHHGCMMLKLDGTNWLAM